MQSLAVGQSVADTFTVTVTGADGTTISKDVAFTVTGANDKPVIAVDASTLTGAVKQNAFETDPAQWTDTDAPAWSSPARWRVRTWIRATRAPTPF